MLRIKITSSYFSFRRDIPIFGTLLLLFHCAIGLAQEADDVVPFKLFPRTVPASADFEYDFAELEGEGRYQLISGPHGLEMDESGKVDWYAGAGYQGRQLLEFSVSQGIKSRTEKYLLQVRYGAPLEVIGAGLPEDSALVVFHKLPIDKPVNSMDLSEDGSVLVVAHQSEDLVSILDPATGELLNQVETPRPSFVLCRGNKAYVADWSFGKVSILDGDRAYEVAGDFSTGLMNVERLHAPSGADFNGIIVAFCDEGRDNQNVMFLRTRGTPPPFRVVSGRCSGASFDYKGRYLMIQGGGGSPARAAESIFTVSGILAGRSETPFDRGYETLPILVQTRPNAFWFGGNAVYYGLPPRRLGTEAGVVVIGDRNIDACYEFHKTGVRCLSLTNSLTLAETRRVVFPESYERMRIETPLMNIHTASEIDFQHVAVTKDGTLRVYLLDLPLGDIYFAETPAMADERGRPANRPAAHSTEPDVQPDASAESSPNNGPFPDSIPVGREWTFKLPQNAVQSIEYNMVVGATGLEVTPQGVVTWTPEPFQRGVHALKIRRKDGSSVDFIESEILVVAAPQDESEDASFRIWTDASGLFSVEAELIEVAAESVQLRTRDGKEIAVRIDSLCDEDRRFLDSRE